MLLSPEERAEKVAASIGQVALWNPTFYSVQQQIADPVYLNNIMDDVDIPNKFRLTYFIMLM